MDPMNITQFPLLTRLLTDPSVYAADRFEKPFSPQLMASLDQVLTMWGEAQAAGGIDNPRFVESKDTITRALEKAWRMIPRDQDYLRTLSPAHYNTLDTCPYPNLSNLEGRGKRVAKTPPSVLRDELSAFITEFKPITDAYTFLKANTKKRVARSQEEIEATRYVPPPSSSRAVAQVRALLEKVMDEAYMGILTSYQTYNRNRIQRYLDAQAAFWANPDTPTRKKRDGYSPYQYLKDLKEQGRMADADSLSFFSKVLEHEPGGPDHHHAYLHKATEATWRRSDAEAEKDAKTVRDQFIYKNLVKLTPVLEAKGDALFDRVEEVGRFVNLVNREGDFKFWFKDGSSFRVHNALVPVVNQFNTHFYRFPLTFHDVRLPGDKPMVLPSEEAMNTTWATAGAEPTTTPTPRRRRAP